MANSEFLDEMERLAKQEGRAFHHERGMPEVDELQIYRCQYGTDNWSKLSISGQVLCGGNKEEARRVWNNGPWRNEHGGLVDRWRAQLHALMDIADECKLRPKREELHAIGIKEGQLIKGAMWKDMIALYKRKIVDALTIEAWDDSKVPENGHAREDPRRDPERGECPPLLLSECPPLLLSPEMLSDKHVGLRMLLTDRHPIRCECGWPAYRGAGKIDCTNPDCRAV